MGILIVCIVHMIPICFVTFIALKDYLKYRGFSTDKTGLYMFICGMIVMIFLSIGTYVGFTEVMSCNDDYFKPSFCEVRE